MKHFYQIPCEILGQMQNCYEFHQEMLIGNYETMIGFGIYLVIVGIQKIKFRLIAFFPINYVVAEGKTQVQYIKLPD